MSQTTPPKPFASNRIGRLQLDGADKLIAQLSFIKKHLRYPIDTQKIIALIGVLFTLPIPIVLWIVLKKNPEHAIPWWMGLLVVMIFVPALASLIRFLQTFKFIAVKSRFTVEENEQLLIRFFQGTQIRFHRHPKSPELFWIMSEQIGRDSDTREVVVFVVEEHRILINAHFTRPRFISPIGKPHHKELAKALQKWMENAPSNSGEIRRA